jgi:hypothetical protein
MVDYELKEPESVPEKLAAREAWREWERRMLRQGLTAKVLRPVLLVGNVQEHRLLTIRGLRRFPALTAANPAENAPMRELKKLRRFIFYRSI